MIARLEKLFFMLLALCPFAMGAVYAFVNMSGGWSRFCERRSYAFYGVLENGFDIIAGLTIAGVVLLFASIAASWCPSGRGSRRELTRDLALVALVSLTARVCFFLVFGHGLGCEGDSLWSWERACGMPVGDSRHVLFPAWMNYSLLMKVFVSFFGARLDLFLLCGTIWGAIGSVAIFLLALEISESRKVAMSAGLINALLPNGVVYITSVASPEHTATPLFCLAAWMMMRCVMRGMTASRTMALAFAAGLCLGFGDAIKPFFPVFLLATLVFAASVSLSFSGEGRRTSARRCCVALAVMAGARFAVVLAFTFASECAFGCRLDQSDPVTHYVSVGLERNGEGMIHLCRYARGYMADRMKGESRERAVASAAAKLADDWKGHYGEIPSFVMKKTIWAWQDDTQGFHFYRNGVLRGRDVSERMKRLMPKVCRYGGSGALVCYFALMSLACVFAIRTAVSATADERHLRILPGLLVMGFFCLLLLSEAQGRYKCLVMPYVTVFAACALLPRGFSRRLGRKQCVADDRMCVVMPVYNERDAVGAVLEKWAKALDEIGMEYVIRPYNDGSRDDSLSVMRATAERLNSAGRIRVDVRDKPNGGHGNTILTGYREAADDGFGWVFQIDSDDEMGPEKFSELWSRRGDFDFLVGRRQGRVQLFPRKVMSLVSRLCVRVFYGKSVWDVNTPYRLMRTSEFRGFYSAIPLTTFAPNVILSGLAARYRLRSFEAPIPQHDRTTGEVSIRKWKLLKCAVTSFLQTVAFSFSSDGVG